MQNSILSRHRSTNSTCAPHEAAPSRTPCTSRLVWLFLPLWTGIDAQDDHCAPPAFLLLSIRSFLERHLPSDRRFPAFLLPAVFLKDPMRRVRGQIVHKGHGVGPPLRAPGQGHGVARRASGPAMGKNSSPSSCARTTTGRSPRRRGGIAPPGRKPLLPETTRRPTSAPPPGGSPRRASMFSRATSRTAPPGRDRSPRPGFLRIVPAHDDPHPARKKLPHRGCVPPRDGRG